MNILHTIPSLGVNSGGPPVSTTLAVKGLRAQGVDAEILTHEASSGGENIIEKEYTHFLPPPLERKFGYSKDFRNYLEKNRKYDLYHCQGVWQYPTYITAKKARKFGKPYVITPRG
ncbi:MAG TPA: glycosyltransferase, partial [Balneolaceae bacterium]|nr:glycosyltransferase [Balneolaceae bacterium]